MDINTIVIARQEVVETYRPSGQGCRPRPSPSRQAPPYCASPDPEVQPPRPCRPWFHPG
jgi:hypothetical protein